MSEYEERKARVREALEARGLLSTQKEKDYRASLRELLDTVLKNPELALTSTLIVLMDPKTILKAKPDDADPQWFERFFFAIAAEIDRRFPVPT